jgi:hypothetical protein
MLLVLEQKLNLPVAAEVLVIEAAAAQIETVLLVAVEQVGLEVITLEVLEYRVKVQVAELVFLVAAFFLALAVAVEQPQLGVPVQHQRLVMGALEQLITLLVVQFIMRMAAAAVRIKQHREMLEQVQLGQRGTAAVILGV